MSYLKGPHFLVGLEGPGAVRLRPDVVEPDLEASSSSTSLVLVTIGGRKVVRYDLSSMVSTASSVLFLPSYMSFASPVCYDPETCQYFVAVSKGSQILMWHPFSGKDDSFKLEDVAKDPESVLEIVGDANIRVTDAVVHQGRSYLVMSDGSLQTLTSLKASNGILSRASGLVPPALKVASTEVFAVVPSDGLYVSHLLVSTPPSDDQPKYYFKTFRIRSGPIDEPSLILEPTGRTDSPISLECEDNDRRAACCACLMENKVVFATSGGTLAWQDALQADEHLGAKSRQQRLNLVDVLKGKKVPNEAEGTEILVRGLAALDQRRVAVLVDRIAGSEILVIDLEFGNVVGNVRTKAVTMDGGGEESALATFGGQHILFKHGQRMAGVIAQDLPRSLADILGCKAFVSSQSSDLKNTENSSRGVELYRIVPEILRGQVSRPKAAVEEARQVLDTYGSQEFPELLVLNLIEMFLTLPDSVFKVEGRLSKKSLLDAAFSVPITEALMTQHLRFTSFKLAKEMLKHLLGSLAKGEDCWELSQVLTWNSLILNAHFSNFVLLKDQEVKDLLQEDLDSIGVLEGSISHLAATLPLLRLIMQKKLVQPATHTNETYSIEMVTF